MNLPKTLIRMEKTENTLLLCFNDDTIIKFVAVKTFVTSPGQSSCVNSNPELVECEPTIRDMEIGLMSDKDYETQRLEIKHQEVS